MSYCTKNIYSHPKKFLSEHLYNVAENSKNITNSLSIDDKSFLSSISFFIGISHDFAKATSFFQKHLSDETYHSEKSFHSQLSAIFGYYSVKSYLKQNNIEYDINYPIISYIVINRHHGNLINVNGENGEKNKFRNLPSYIQYQMKDLESSDLSNLEEFYEKYNINLNYFLDNFEDILREIKSDFRAFVKENNIINYFMINLLYSILIDSDKLDASYTKSYPRKDIEYDIVDIYKSRNFTKTTRMNNIREEAYQEVKNNIKTLDLNKHIYSITLPTGSGKTITTFSAALNLRQKLIDEKKIKPRIIYTLPFLSIIDQNEKVIRNILKEKDYTSSDYLIKHNSLSEIYYKTSKNDELNTNNAELLIEGWYSEIVITTFYQLFYTLISNKNRSLKKLHNISNSIIILDEVQSIPPKYWKIFNMIFNHLSEKLNIWIIFITATQPAIFEENEIIELVDNKNYYFNKFNRLNYHVDLNNKTVPELCEQIISRISKTDKNIMIVVNTIQSSLDIYNNIKNNINKEIRLYYLSTNIIPKQRLNLIREINENSNQKIIISTQLIEAGVDIDMDIVYRDFAPIDSIVQTAGRCNRNNNKEKGEMNVISLINENNRKYSSMIYNSVLLDTTYKLLKDITHVSEKEFNSNIIDEYFNQIKDKISEDQSNSLINDLNKLNYSNLSKEFKLIEENIDKLDVFIEIDEEAIKIWEEFTTTINNHNLERLEKKQKLKRIYPKLREYIISIDTKKAGTINIEDFNMGYIGKDDLDRKYDINTGFIPSDEENGFII